MIWEHRGMPRQVGARCTIERWEWGNGKFVLLITIVSCITSEAFSSYPRTRALKTSATKLRLVTSCASSSFPVIVFHFTLLFAINTITKSITNISLAAFFFAPLSRTCLMYPPCGSISLISSHCHRGKAHLV